MLRFLAPLILLTSTASLEYSRHQSESAASPAQIKFAEENKYDDTGPGAKQPEYAYHTFKTLDEALVAYLDDPDTKLPDFERAKALDILFNRAVPYKPPQNYYKKPYSPLTNYLYEPKKSFTSYDSRYQMPKASSFTSRWKSPFVKTRYSPANYMREPVAEEHRPSPAFSYSYGVHDQNPSGSVHKSAPVPVHGHYAFVGADGSKRSTIQYYGAGGGGGKTYSSSVKHV